MRLVSDKGMAWLNRAVISGRIVPYLVAMMLAIMLVAAATVPFLSLLPLPPPPVHFLSPKAFETWGDEIWWAAQTVTTVGYGDVVPTTGGGRFIAGVVMFFSVATVSLVTAVVTAGFVAYQQRRLSGEAERHAELRDALHRIERRLDRLER
jgi:voltage-gated potassium channel Kch